MQQCLPAFEASTANSLFGPGRLYIDRSVKPECFVFFQFSEKRDAFTVELAWSMLGVFPSFEGSELPRDWPEIGAARTDTGVSAFRFRLSKLWELPKYDPWWEFSPRFGGSKSAKLSVVADQSLEDVGRCSQLVMDALEKLRVFGCPYFAEVRSRPRSKPATG
jgi:hypothetical protein